MLTPHNKKVLLLLLALSTITLQVVAISTPYWATQSMSQLSEKSHWGLWKDCITLGGAKQCTHLPPSGNDKFKKNSLEATRAFAIMGPVLVFLGMVLPIAKAHIWKCMLLLLGSLSSLIAMTIFATELLKPFEDQPSGMKGTPGYSFYLNMVGGVMGLVTVLVCWKA